jgi:hypothetical protein
MGDVRAKAAVGADFVAVLANAFGHIEHDSDGKAVILAREFDQRLAIFGLHVRGIDNCQTARGKALRGNKVQDVKGVVGCGKVILIVGKVLLPEPEAPMSTTRDKSGNVNFCFMEGFNRCGERCPSGWVNRASNPPDRWAGTPPSNDFFRKQDLPRPEILRGSIQSDGPCGGTNRREGFQI